MNSHLLGPRWRAWSHIVFDNHDKRFILLLLANEIAYFLRIFYFFVLSRSGDDLLPIVSFVIVKTNYPQIISECHAMEEFIHEG